MYNELLIITSALPVCASADEYRTAIVDDNVLGKPTTSSRQKSFRHVVQLYGMDPSLILFHTLRIVAEESPESLPMLGLVCAFARDPQLRHSFKLIESLRPGEEMPRIRMEEHFESGFPGRFSESMKKSLAQNVNTSWGIGGHLTGRTRKYRAIPASNSPATTYATFAGYLLGLRGDLLLQSTFVRLVEANTSLAISQLGTASARGWLRFRHGGGITEIDFDTWMERHKQEVSDGTR